MDATLQKIIILAPIVWVCWSKLKDYIKGEPKESEPYKPHLLSRGVSIKEPNVSDKPEKEKLLVEAFSCNVCGKPYIQKVEHQKYCSAKCRTKANSKKV
ncbi:MAG: hypothetical protein RIS64_3604 [Bacteroidota bacterium]|jgi:hypothetical protein